MREFCESNFSFYAGSLGFYVRSIGCYCQVPPHRQRIKRVDFAEIFWGIGGSGCFFDGAGEQYTVRPGGVWYYPPGSEHNYVPGAGGFHYRWLAVGGANAGMLFSSLNIRPGLTFCGVCPEELFCRIDGSIRRPDRQLSLLADAVAILARIAGAGEGKRLVGDPAERIRTLADDNFRDADFNVNALAEKLDRHRCTVSKQFRERYRINISEYLNSLRCQEGIRLLRETELPIAEIPRQCGFSSLEYFYHTVRKATGETPAAIRRASRHGG